MADLITKGAIRKDRSLDYKHNTNHHLQATKKLLH